MCNSRAVDMGAALRQKGRVSGVKKRGEITNKKIAARKEEKKAPLPVVSARIEEGIGRKTLRYEDKKKSFLPTATSCHCAVAPSAIQPEPCVPPILFPDLSTNRLRLLVASRECKRWGFWCCYRACLRCF